MAENDGEKDNTYTTVIRKSRRRTFLIDFGRITLKQMSERLNYV
jgi:hypothetical protein